MTAKRSAMELHAELDTLRQRVRALEETLNLPTPGLDNSTRPESLHDPLLVSMQEGFAYCEMVYDETGSPVDFIYLAVNPAFERLTGLTNVTGRPVSQVIPGIHEATPELFAIYSRVARTGLPEQFEIDFTPLDIWLSIHVYCPQKGYFAAVFENITERKMAEQQRHAYQTNLSALIENINGSIWSIDRQYRLIIGNRIYHENVSAALGRRLQNGESVLEPSFPKDVLLEWRAFYDRALQGESFRVEVKTRFRQQPQWVDYRFSPIRQSNGEISGATIFGQTIQSQKEAEQALKVSLEKYRVLFETFPLGISITDANGEIIETNHQAEILLGLPRAEQFAWVDDRLDQRIVRPDLTLMPPEEFASVRALKEQRLIEIVEVGFVKANDQITWLSVNAAPIPLDDFGVVIAYGDISESKRTREALAQALQEKEALLRELYHRTKNNMQVISAMLSLKAAEIKHLELRDAFQEMVTRINAMALVHEKLYQSSNLSNLNLREYITDLVNLQLSNYPVNPEKIHLDLSVDEMQMNIDTAIPLGMVLTELLSNVMKHAFPNGSMGQVRISLHRKSDGCLELEVADDGIGFPEGFDPQSNGSMGLRSVLAICRLQLQADVKFESKNGVSCRLKFRCPNPIDGTHPEY